MTELEQEIKKIIETETEREYISKLRVIKEDDFYTLYLYLNRELVPLVISIQGDEGRFKDLIKSEIKKRRLHEVKFWKTDRTLPSIDCNGEIGW